MRVVVIGTFPAATKERIVGSFPADWTVFAGTAAEAEGQLRDADVVIPEHIRVDDAFLGRAPRLAMVQTGAGYDNVDIAACTKRGVRTRRIAGACLDVYEQEPLPPDSPLRDLPNVLLTPHTAGLPDGVRFYAGRYRFSLWITSGASWPARSQSTRSTMFLSGGGPDKTAAYRRQEQGEGP